MISPHPPTSMVGRTVCVLCVCVCAAYLDSTDGVGGCGSTSQIEHHDSVSRQI